MQSSSHKERFEELRQNIKRLEIRLTNLTKLRSELDSKLETSEAVARQRTDKATLKDYFSTSYEGQMKNIKQLIQTLDREIRELETHCGQIEAECAGLAQKQGEMQREKEMLLLKKESLEKFRANP